MRLAIVGSRTIEDFDLTPLIPQGVTMIVSGGARGVDTVAARYAREHGIALTELRPDFVRYGRAACHVRNRSIVEVADAVLAVWDGKSRGTRSTIELARRAGKVVTVHEV